MPAEEKPGVKGMTEQPGQLSFEKFEATGALIAHRLAFRLASWVKSSERADASGAGDVAVAAPNEVKANSNTTAHKVNCPPAANLFEPLLREIIRGAARLWGLDMK